MSALDGGTFGLTEEFDRLVDRLFEIAEAEGRRLSIRVSSPRGLVRDERGRVLGRLRQAKPAKKRKRAA